MKHLRPSTAAQLGHLTALLQRVAGGNAHAFDELHALTRRKLQRTAAAACQGSCDVDDVLQDSYLKIWRAASNFDSSRASPITWMCTIVRNTALDSARARRLPAADLSDAMDVPAPVEDVEDFDYELARRLADEALLNLPEDRRRLISLAYVEGMSRLSLAEQFGVPVGTIKTWLRRLWRGFGKIARPPPVRSMPSLSASPSGTSSLRAGVFAMASIGGPLRP